MSGPDMVPPSFEGIVGVTIQPLACRLTDLRITLDAPERRLDPAARARVDAFWERATAANPRLFDGPMLSCVETDPDAAILRCRRATFRHLVCQPTVETGTMQTSVTGVLTAFDERDRHHVLLARRGPHTRVYPGMWELAPSGGIDPPTPTTSGGPGHLTGQDAWAQLTLELEEELAPLGLGGIASYLSAPDPPCLCIDHAARSVDIVLPVRVRFDPTEPGDNGPPDPAGWEYTDARWVPLHELTLFDKRHAADIIPPTRALLRFFGWV